MIYCDSYTVSVAISDHPHSKAFYRSFANEVVPVLLLTVIPFLTENR